MELDDKTKFEIIVSQLNERYNALHKMRERSLRFTLWILGICLGFSYMIICKSEITSNQKIPITIFFVVTLLLSLYFLRSINNGFNNTLRIIKKLEKALGLYKKNYLIKGEPVLPKQYVKSNCLNKFSGHFCTLYALLISVFILLIIFTAASKANQIEHHDALSPPVNNQDN